MRRLLSLLIILVMTGGVLAAAPAHADEPAPIVTWPEITRFNPELVDYEVQLSDAGGEGELVAWWGYNFARSAPLPHVGSAALEFGHEGNFEVVVARCEAGYWRLSDCAEVARSPRLTVLTEIGRLTVEMDRVVGRGTAEVQIQNYYNIDVERYDWEIFGYPYPGRALATGTAKGPFRKGPQGTDVLDFQGPPTLGSGTYELRVTGTASTPEYGVVSGVGNQTFRYNPVIPTLKVTQSGSTFHPYPDGCQDAVALDVGVNQYVGLALEVTDGKGTAVHRSTGSAWLDSPGLVRWAGTDSAGRRVAPGTYNLVLRGLSDGGNEAQWHGKVVVSGKRLVTVTRSFTVGAAAARSSRPYVGACSKLARRAKGGLGFYSQTTCTGSLKRSMVAVSFGAYLPRAIEGRYRSVQVTLNGGPATRSRTNYINLAYVAPKTQKLVKVKSLRGKGALRGKVASPHLIFDRTKERPYLIWWAGLTAGSRFDVSSFRVTTTYQVLR
ncbi:hypothetical protein NODU109028_07745 [Nocardioides dubius]|uniref:FlgD Ig-like domain-containing protein n=1 Tax=Nocardioides dubius TaxID=317019 RepID=A0ABN1TXS9_9ACTN